MVEVFIDSLPQYLTFKGASGYITAEIISVNKHTIIARPITFGRRSMVSGIIKIIKKHPAKKFKKKRVIIYKKGITPIF